MHFLNSFRFNAFYLSKVKSSYLFTFNLPKPNKLKSIFAILSIVLLSSFNLSRTVYVCYSTTSVAYHGIDNCRGLNSCSHTIKSMSVSEAIELGKRPCKVCGG